MKLDSPPLIFLRTPISIIAASMVWLFGRCVPDARGTKAWALATLFMGSTGILFGLRGGLPFFLTVEGKVGEGATFYFTLPNNEA